MSSVKDKLTSFINSRYYVVFIALLCLIGHTFSIEEICFAFMYISAVLGFFLCKNLNFFLSPLLMFTFMWSQKRVGTDVFFSKPYLIAMAVGAVILILAIVAFFIRNKCKDDFRKFCKSKLFYGFLFWTVAILLNGFFDFSEYTVGNFVYSIVLSSSLILAFFVFSAGCDFSDGFRDYLTFILFCCSLLITAEFYLLFINQIRFDGNGIVKESIMAGWGMWNNIGGMLAFLLPVHFYFACTKKRGWIYLITGLISFFAIFLSLSRSSLLFGSLAILICFIVTCFKGNNPKICRIVFLSLLAVGTVGLIALFPKISNIVGDYLSRGLDDNGRFEMYKDGLRKFVSHPIFGCGFYNSYPTEHQFISFLPYRYHNTFIEMMATCGIAGIASYLYHRYQTIKLALQNKSLYTLFVYISVFTMLLCSLLDNHLFNIYPALFYCIMLLSVEYSNEKCLS